LLSIKSNSIKKNSIIPLIKIKGKTITSLIFLNIYLFIHKTNTRRNAIKIYLAAAALAAAACPFFKKIEKKIG
jgi:hypothetical protein